MSAPRPIELRLQLNSFGMGRSFATIWDWLYACQGMWSTRYSPQELGITYKAMPLSWRDPFHPEAH